MLLLKEWQGDGVTRVVNRNGLTQRDPGRYTGAEKAVQVTYILREHAGLAPGYVIMGIYLPGEIG